MPGNLTVSETTFDINPDKLGSDFNEDACSHQVRKQTTISDKKNYGGKLVRNSSHSGAAGATGW